MSVFFLKSFLFHQTMAPTNKVADLIRYYSSELKAFYPEAEAKALIERLIHFFFTINKLDVVKNPEVRLNETEMLQLHFAVKELKHYKPLQYVVGEADFDGHRFMVNEGVLIPRPETEQLVQLASDFLAEKPQCTVADIGTGSGCIAISLAIRHPQHLFFGFDVSSAALQVAQTNAELLGAKVNFVACDILNDEACLSSRKYDLMLSNPPYVVENEKHFMQPNVLDWEPDLALFVSENDPLLFYRRIAFLAAQHLNDGGKLMFEINERFATETVELLKGMGFKHIEVFVDFNDKDRFISAVWKV